MIGALRAWFWGAPTAQSPRETPAPALHRPGGPAGPAADVPARLIGP
jgi:hypothetical protein